MYAQFDEARLPSPDVNGYYVSTTWSETEDVNNNVTDCDVIASAVCFMHCNYFIVSTVYKTHDVNILVLTVICVKACRQQDYAGYMLVYHNHQQ